MARLFGFLLAVFFALIVCMRIGGLFAPKPDPMADVAVTTGGRVVDALPPDPGTPASSLEPLLTTPFDCTQPIKRNDAALENTRSLSTLTFAPFGRQEYGWETYAPWIAREVGSRCPPGSPEFAEALGRWQARNGLPSDGIVTPALFQTLMNRWHRRRPYVAVRARGVCPDPPPETSLAVATPAESYGGKTLMLRPGALEAYRRMIAAARRDAPEIFVEHPDMLKIYSAFRSPESDAARCERDGNCDGIVRANCSPHRTGLAMDIVVGQAPGYQVDSSADPNRLFMSKTAGYRWLVANAERYGFFNYVFEPWHWEWAGEAR